jgi:hypothetical protein
MLLSGAMQGDAACATTPLNIIYSDTGVPGTWNFTNPKGDFLIQV